MTPHTTPSGPLAAAHDSQPAQDGQQDGHRYDPSHLTPETAPVPVAAAQSDENLLIQASQILQQMQARTGAVEQREAAVHSEEVRQKQRAADLESRLKEVSADQQRLGQQSQTLDARTAELDQLQKKLDAQRMSMREQVNRELEHERQLWKEKNEALEQQQDRLRQLDDQRRSEHQQLLEQLQESFTVDGEQQRQTIRSQMESEFTQRRRDVEARESQLNTQVQELENAQQQFEQLRIECQSSLEAEREQQETEIREQRQEFERDRQQRARQLKHEATLMDNRHRFQAEHLQTTRNDLETQLRDLQQAQQQLRLQQEQSELMILLRNRQLEHFRALLEEREHSVQREHALQSRARTVRQNELQHDIRKLAEDRSTWERMQTAQQSDIQRQHDLLNMHGQNLESRRERLDQLRTELEITHRDNLEIRMAIEEAWSQLVQGAGQNEAKSRVDAARKALSEHYDFLRTTLAQQRQELTEAESQLQHQKDDFLKQRQATTECLAQRDETLRNREEQLRVSSTEFDIRETGWREARDGWMQERVEAEHIIRGLLIQLTEFNNPNREQPGDQDPAAEACREAVQQQTERTD